MRLFFNLPDDITLDTAQALIALTKYGGKINMHRAQQAVTADSIWRRFYIDTTGVWDADARRATYAELMLMLGGTDICCVSAVSNHQLAASTQAVRELMENPDAYIL